MDQCDTCTFYVYDDEYEEYFCEADMDEDDYSRLMTGSHKVCPFYRDADEYKVVRHQI
ncbi:MAG: DUF6472 family protein [Lachnospiraceae bacterium]|nr:DUF6472 family protein [Lachnospiraceae bacterium]